MARVVNIHPDSPQQRLLAQAAEFIRDGGIVALPTDSCYALGCHLGDKEAMDRISGSGVFARDPDAILVLTALNVPDAYALVGTLWLLTLVAAEGHWRARGRTALAVAAAMSLASPF